jgi:hypothetical protein
VDGMPASIGMNKAMVPIKFFFLLMFQNNYFFPNPFKRISSVLMAEELRWKNETFSN